MSKEDGIKNQFEKFCEAFKRANPSDQKKGVQKLAIKEWNQLKASLVENPNAIIDKMQEFRLKESQEKTKKLQFWDKFKKSDQNSKSTQNPKSDQNSSDSQAEEPKTTDVKEKRQSKKIECFLI